MVDSEILRSFSVTNILSGWELTETWGVATPETAGGCAYWPSENRVEVYYDMHKLRSRLLYLSREIDWIPMA